MWVRKRIDIPVTDLMYGIAACMRNHDRDELQTQIESQWVPGQTFSCLSVRSGFDLLLQTMDWPAGSEILMSGMTIPHMPEIVRRHGLVPIGLDLDVGTLAVSAEEVRAKITPRTRAIVIAHLFGGLTDIRPIIEIAREHDLLVIEDCAQAYVGNFYTGDQDADVSMFSFGAIKTNTSLCGGVLNVRRRQLLEKMNRRHAAWPRQTRWTMLKRLLKYGFVKLLSTWFMSSAVATALRLVGKDHDGLAVKLSRGFSGGDFFQRIRQQPSSALLSLMNRRFENFDQQTVVKRTSWGLKINRAFQSVACMPGEEMKRPTWWVLPILVEDPDRLTRYLWKHGFDGTHSCSLAAVNDGDGGLPGVTFILKHIVFLPFDLKISPREMRRMVGLIRAYQPGKLEAPPVARPMLTDRIVNN